MRPLTGAVLLAAGCRSLLGIDDPVHRADASTVIDGELPDAADAGSGCYGGALQVCTLAKPMPSYDGTGSIDTTSNACSAVIALGSAGSACVVLAKTVTIDNLRAFGSNGFIVIATESLTVTGTLDVSSSAGNLGAGAEPADCALIDVPPTDGSGAAGGDGGSFAGSGGLGGVGAHGFGATVPVAAAMPTAAPQGGCGGGSGGSAVGNGGDGGRGGGMAYLIAPTITIDHGAEILAGGSPGLGGSVGSGGGGGGGTGGFVGLDAHAIMFDGVIVASGGGGGGGGGDMTGGNPGKAPTATAPLAGGGAGGQANPGGNTGGNGGGNFTDDEGDGSAGSGGGAGGGGGAGAMGFVWVTGTPVGSGSCTPAATQK